MQTFETESLKPDGFYWARRVETGAIEIVQVSTVFGSEIEFLTLAVIGTDQHFMLNEFDLLMEIVAPNIASASNSSTALDSESGEGILLSSGSRP